MRWGLPAALLAVLGLSCGSSSGEEVATDVVAFQPYSYKSQWSGLLAIRRDGEVVEYRSEAPPSTLHGLIARRLSLPLVEGNDGHFSVLGGTGVPPYNAASVQAVSATVVRCFRGNLCQTSAGDIVDVSSLGPATLKVYSAVHGASTCSGFFCIVGGQVLALDGTKVTSSGDFVDVVGISWSEVGQQVYSSGAAFLRADGSVVTAGRGPERNYVRELTGLPRIQRVYPGGLYEDYAGHVWYVGIAPEGWAVDIFPADVARQTCKVAIGPKLSVVDVPCVGPTMLPALEGMQLEIEYGGSYIPILYALDKAGTLRCWSAPGGPACVKGE